MSSKKCVVFVLVVLVILLVVTDHQCLGMDTNTKIQLKEKVVEMFNHAYQSYMTNAFPADELMPLSCKGRYRGSERNRGDIDDSLGNFTLTLIDSLDTIAVLGDIPEFEKAVKLVIRHTRFDTDVVVSVFETNIRVLGGLLGGHVIATYLRRRKFAMEWYKDELLAMAKDIGTRLLPAFNTSTGIPYPRVNLKTGIRSDEIRNFRDTCTACAGTMILEFAALSRLTGDPVFEDKAHKAMDYLWNQRHRTSDLVGTVINIHNGDWIRRESGVGAGIDSYYEYVLKAYILLGDDSYLTRFNKHYDAVKKYISQGPRFVDVHMHRPQSSSRNFMDALLAFWPGLQVLKGDIQPAIEVHEMLYQVIQRHNFLPEAFTADFNVHWGHHPLRPEFVESTYFLYKATGDAHYLEVGQKVIENLDALARVPCGFAAIKDVTKVSHEDQMDSFVLAETFKYLYLLYAEKSDLLFDVDDYIFTTEAHLLPLSLSRHNSSKPAEMRLSRDMYSHLQQIDDEARQEDEYGDSDHNTCPNPQVKYRMNYAHDFRARLKDMVGMSMRGSSPKIMQCPQVIPSSPRLKAEEFVAGNQDQLQQLQDMGIKLMTMSDGRIQLLHTASEALTPQLAENGLLFMQEMIALSKTQPQETQHEPMLIKVMTPPHEELIFRAGPAQFGYDLLKRPNIRGKLVIGDPYKMCGPGSNWSDLKGRIVIVERGNCMFIDKARHLQLAGAIGGIVIDHNPDSTIDTQPLFAMSGDTKDDVYIPLLFLYHIEGQRLLDLLDENEDLEVVMAAKLDQFVVPPVPHVDQTSEEAAEGTSQEKTQQFYSGPQEDAVLDIKKQADGTKQIYFNFDKLNKDGTTMNLEELYENIRETLVRKTNFATLEKQSTYLTVIVKILQAAYFNKKLDSTTQYLFKEFSKELEYVEQKSEDKDLDSIIDAQQAKVQIKIHQDGATEQVKFIHGNNVGVKIKTKFVKPVKEGSEQVAGHSYADEGDLYDDSEHSTSQKHEAEKYTSSSNSEGLNIHQSEASKQKSHLEGIHEQDGPSLKVLEQHIQTDANHNLDDTSSARDKEDAQSEELMSEIEKDYAILQETVNPELAAGLKKVIDDSAQLSRQTGSPVSHAQDTIDNHKQTTSPDRGVPAIHKPVFEKTVRNLKQNEEKDKNTKN